MADSSAQLGGLVEIPATGPSRQLEPDSHSIPVRFSRIVSRFSDRVAVTSGPQQWTYAELAQRASMVAAAIASAGMADTGVVALLMEHDAALVSAILGVLTAGKLYTCLDGRSPPAYLAAILNDSQARLLICDSAHSALAQSLAANQCEVLSVEDIERASRDSSSGRNDLLVRPDSGAWLMYTSGSTGAPKGVWQNHRNVLHHAAVYRHLIAAAGNDRFTLLTSCSVAASAAHLFTALLTGARLCLFPLRTQGIDRLAEWLQREEITVYHSVPTIFRRLLASRGSAAVPESCRLARLGGEELRPADVHEFQQNCRSDCRLMNAFSSTETSLATAWFLDRGSYFDGDLVPAGEPVPAAEVLILDDHKRPVPQGHKGRIAVRSPHLACGYWRQPQRTAERFLRDHAASESGAVLFLTNDRGRFRPDGVLEYLGRSDHQIKIRGHRVELGEVETTLRATNLVEDCAVLAGPGESGDTILTAFVVPLGQRRFSAGLCRRALRKLLPPPLIPAAFIVLSSLPQTGSGKIDRVALREQADRRGRRALLNDKPRARPRDPLERKLALFWKQTLGLEEVGRNDDFFALGGDSLRSVQLLARIEEKFSVVLSPSILTEHGTIEKLARVIAAETFHRSNGQRVMLRQATTGRPLFLIHNGRGSVAGYGPLVQRVSPRPVFGFQAPGLLGESWPLRSIPAFASRYVQEVLRIDPTGPYLLCGTCSGGMIVFEMAQQLIRRGLTVAMVALFDSKAPLPRRQYPRWHDRVAGRVLYALRDTGRLLRWSVLSSLNVHRHPRRLPAYRKFVANCLVSAYRRYQPVPYPGTITLFITTASSENDEDRRTLMAKLSRSADIVRIPGTRPDLFRPPSVDLLARELDARIAALEADF